MVKLNGEQLNAEGVFYFPQQVIMHLIATNQLSPPISKLWTLTADAEVLDPYEHLTPDGPINTGEQQLILTFNNDVDRRYGVKLLNFYAQSQTQEEAAELGALVAYFSYQAAELWNALALSIDKLDSHEDVSMHLAEAIRHSGGIRFYDWQKTKFDAESAFIDALRNAIQNARDDVVRHLVSLIASDADATLPLQYRINRELKFATRKETVDALLSNRVVQEFHRKEQLKIQKKRKREQAEKESCCW